MRLLSLSSCQVSAQRPAQPSNIRGALSCTTCSSEADGKTARTQIANLASHLTIHRRQTIHGAGPQGTIALLLFDDDSVADVVPAFERLAQKTVPSHLLDMTPPRVLAARLTPGTAKAYPQSLSCYLPGFATSSAQSTPELITAVRTTRAHLQTSDRHTPQLSRPGTPCVELPDAASSTHCPRCSDSNAAPPWPRCAAWADSTRSSATCRCQPHPPGRPCAVRQR